LPILAKVIIWFYGIDTFKTVLLYVVAFLYVKLIGILTIIIYDANKYALKKPFGFLVTMIFSGFISEFTQVALMIFLIELSLALYCLMIFGIAIFMKNTVVKLYRKFLTAFFPHQLCNPYEPCW